MKQLKCLLKGESKIMKAKSLYTGILLVAFNMQVFSQLTGYMLDNPEYYVAAADSQFLFEYPYPYDDSTIIAKKKYQYTQTGKLEKVMVYNLYNTGYNFTLYATDEYQYNDGDTLTVIINESGVDHDYDIDKIKNEYLYMNNKLSTEYISYHYPDSDVWTLHFKLEYIYNAEGNINEVDTYYPDNTDWKILFKSEYDYESSGDSSTITKLDYEERLDSNNEIIWFLIHTTISYYDQNDKCYLIEGDNYRSILEYNIGGAISREIVYYDYGELYSKSEYSYNTIGQLIMKRNFLWDSYNQQWSKTYSPFYTYQSDPVTIQSPMVEPLMVYPNPADDYLYINGLPNGAMVSVYSITSNTVIIEKIENSSIVISGLPYGLYLLHAGNDYWMLFMKR